MVCLNLVEQVHSKGLFMLLGQRHNAYLQYVISYPSRLPEFIVTTRDKNDGSMIVWLDFSKYGALSNSDLNNAMALVQEVLVARPERSCCFCIAPLLESDRRSGFQAECRLGYYLTSKTISNNFKLYKHVKQLVLN